MKRKLVNKVPAAVPHLRQSKPICAKVIDTGGRRTPL
jgi:hypothetical protein